MKRKFFNTQLINAGMAEEIREHMMGHKFKDRVRDAYYLADPDDLRKTYLSNIDYLNVKSSPVNYSVDEIRELQQLVAGMKKELRELKGEA
jgi:hypothetical protein